MSKMSYIIVIAVLSLSSILMAQKNSNHFSDYALGIFLVFLSLLSSPFIFHREKPKKHKQKLSSMCFSSSRSSLYPSEVTLIENLLIGLVSSSTIDSLATCDLHANSVDSVQKQKPQSNVRTVFALLIRIICCFDRDFGTYMNHID